MEFVYIIFSNNDKIYPGGYGEFSPEVEYLSLSEDSAKKYLESKRYEYFTTKGNEIEIDKPEQFACSIGLWYYNYWLEKYPLDAEIKAYFSQQNM